MDEATQPPVLDFSKITLDEDEGPATEEEEEEEGIFLFLLLLFAIKFLNVLCIFLGVFQQIGRK